MFGDRVIILIGNYIENFMGTQGMIARWGGDEFAGIIYGSMEVAENMALELMGKINSESEFVENKITISLGITQVQKLDTPDIILSRADKGLYIAKEKGKNQVHIVK